MSAYYGQKGYSERLGNGPWTLAQAGCFVAAFSNLLKKFGDGDVPPNVLNVWFIEHNVYLADPSEGKGVRDNLGYSSITAYDPSIHVAYIGGHGWPDSDMAIVEFEFIQNGKKITHFCAMDSIKPDLIIDSFDGGIKHSIYGTPVSFATYVKNQPKTIPNPYPAPVHIPAPNYDGHAITIQQGWGLANAAKAAGYPDWDAPSRWEIIAKENGHTDWQAFNAALKPGQRIVVGKPHTHHPEPPVVIDEPHGYKRVTVQWGWGLERVAAAAGRPDAATQSCWQTIAEANNAHDWQTYNKHLQPGQLVQVPPFGGHGEGIANPSANQFQPSKVKLDKSTAGTYQATSTITYRDLSDPAQIRQLAVHEQIKVAGTFTWQNVNYALPDNSYHDNTCFAVPLDFLDVPEIEAEVTKIEKGVYGSIVAIVGSIVGVLTRKKHKQA